MKKYVLPILIISFTFIMSANAFAYDAPYKSYTYNAWDKSVEAPQIYLPYETYTGTQTGTANFKSPQDIFVSGDGNIYVADSGNGRIVELNNDFTFKREIIGFTEPTGVYVKDDKIYVADKGGVVYVETLDGETLLTIQEPKHPLIADDFLFSPMKITADNAGRIYILSYGCYLGLMQFDASGQFLGYYGANPVEMTPELYMDYMWKQLLSREQRESMMRLLPVEYSNMSIGADGFVYTTTISANTTNQQIKKLNPMGNNVLLGKQGTPLVFGDIEYDLNLDKQVRSAFADVMVDEAGLIYGLDRTRGHLFLYDAEGELVGVFGGIGNQKGTFRQPSAIDILGDRVIVLDASKNNITVFAPTSYMKAIKEGLSATKTGEYAQTLPLWQNTAGRNSNLLLAQIGMGKAYEQNDEYLEAVRAYKNGASRYNYSNAFRYLRLDVTRLILPIAAVVIIIVVIVFYTITLVRKHKRRQKS